MPLNDQLGAVREAHRLDQEALQAYLSDHIQGFGELLELQQFRGGQSNPTYLLTTSSPLSTSKQRYVLRKKPPGKLLPSAHAVEREYRVMRALEQHDIPVPPVLHLCEDASIIGTPFFVMTWIDGRIFRKPSMPEVATPKERHAIVAALIKTLAQLHAIDYRAADLSSYGKPDNYMGRQVSRWSRQYAASKSDDIDAMDKLTAWLDAHLPKQEGASVVHGDFRLENAIVHPERASISAILDWELSTLGHPLADLGFHCMLYHLPQGDHAASGFLGVDLATLGIPSQDELVQMYAQASGRNDTGDIDYFIAFGLFRMAAIVQGVYKRGLDGNASSDTALMYGPFVRQLAQVGWSIAQASGSGG
jgi:aminoglycoside phosphotransferase (APT) family kinase protein